MIKAQTDAQELAQKSQDAQQKGQLEVLSERLKALTGLMQLQNSREERDSRERIEGAKIANERMQLAEAALVHPMATPVAQQFAQLWPGLGSGRVI